MSHLFIEVNITQYLEHTSSFLLCLIDIVENRIAFGESMRNDDDMRVTFTAKLKLAYMTRRVCDEAMTNKVLSIDLIPWPQ